MTPCWRAVMAHEAGKSLHVLHNNLSSVKSHFDLLSLHVHWLKSLFSLVAGFEIFFFFHPWDDWLRWLMFFGVDTPPTSSWFLVFSFDSWYNSRRSHPVPSALCSRFARSRCASRGRGDARWAEVVCSSGEAVEHENQPYWLVVSNMAFIFHNIWDNPSRWRTHIFQDG